MPLELYSKAFSMGGALPVRHSAEGVDLSPPLHWVGVPRTARSLALLVEDPDASEGPFVHWLAWNLPAESRELAEGAGGLRQGLNGYGRPGWGGPRPPCRKGAHRYVFRLFALDRLLDLDEHVGREAFEAALAGHVLDEARLVGKYHRRSCSCANGEGGCSRGSGCGRH
jgi:Raf kinase inhibitor-like YbhB/YbcL family protein